MIPGNDIPLGHMSQRNFPLLSQLSKYKHKTKLEPSMTSFPVTMSLLQDLAAIH